MATVPKPKGNIIPLRRLPPGLHPSPTTLAMAAAELHAERPLPPTEPKDGNASS